LSIDDVGLLKSEMTLQVKDRIYKALVSYNLFGATS
jgi:hypothetical protein